MASFQELEQKLRDAEQIRWELIPPKIMAALLRYRDEHKPVGHFVTAVLENDLHSAVGRADEDSFLALRSIVGFVYNEFPLRAWGSPEKVKEWLK